MKTNFIDNHLQIILKSLSETQSPPDLFLSGYFKKHKSLGSKDRKIIGDTVYGMIRWKSLLDFFNPKNRLAFFQKNSLETLKNDPSVPIHARLGMTPFLYQKLCENFGEEKTKFLGSFLNENAPTTIRVNEICITREALFNRWKNKFDFTLCQDSNLGIQFKKREALFALEEFKNGFFEVQDEGSQLIAQKVKAKPKDIILDYCSGSGGKTLAFAPQTEGKGQIYLHDIRLHALVEAKKRLKRAKIQNAQCLKPDHPQLQKLIGKCDWVLLDVPCSGTGTLRRNPDQKWKIDKAMLERLKKTQREIVIEASKYLKKTGRLVYATCSILKEENQDQIDFLTKELSLEIEGPVLNLSPVPGGRDGFFAATLKRKED